jgi:hypothetical protein
MSQDWMELTKLTGGAAMTVEKIKIKDKDIVIEGSFDLPPLAQLTMEDQTFITAFVRSHGSIKEMEQLFGISYPTVKNRLNAVSRLLEFVEINPPASKNEILDELDSGRITVEEAVQKMRSVR